MDIKNKKLYELLLAAEQEGVECRENPDLFFPEDWDYDGTTGMSAKARKLAKQMCLRCPLKSQCLDYALEAKEFGGIWGGLSYRERLSIQQKTHR